MNFKEYLREKTEMEDHFHNRTRRHITTVKKWAKRIDAKFPGEFPGLIEQAKDHDASKLEEPEYTPYLHVTWKYREKANGREYTPSKEIEDAMHEATEHHVKNNKHHPEYFDSSSKINKENRDAPSGKLVDATKMDNISIAEMCADWIAVAEEKNTAGAKAWADANVNIRWKFTEEQTRLIYNILEVENDFN